MIIGITGKLGSGKSTIAEYLVDKHNYIEYSFATPLKQIGGIFGFTYDQLYGTQENKLEIHPYWGVSSREFLQKVGTELFREALPKIIPEMKISSVWVDLFKLKFYETPDIYVISDVRFLDEAKAIRDLGGIIIRTERTNRTLSITQKETQHRSEIELERIPANYVINNDKLTKEEAQKEIDRIIYAEFAKKGILKL